MNPTLRRTSAWVVAALAVNALLVLSCARKPTGVDPSYSTPEGAVSLATRLFVWPERSGTAALFNDLAPFGPDPDDEFVGLREYRERPEGTVSGLVLDHTLASEFQILRRESEGGIRPLFEQGLAPRRRWPDLGWDAFQFADPTPLEGVTPAYVARGLVDGSPTTYSPLSNFAEAAANPIADIALTFPTDTTATWAAVPGAALYISHVYQFRSATPQDEQLASVPKPLFIGKSLDFFIGLSTEPRVVGRNLPFDGVVLTRRDMIPGQYLFSVSAIDAAGNLIARCSGDPDLIQSEGSYEIYSKGAAFLPRE
jgi:hypothetical protein